MNKKGVGTIFGAICGLTALTAILAEVFSLNLGMFIV